MQPQVHSTSAPLDYGSCTPIPSIIMRTLSIIAHLQGVEDGEEPGKDGGISIQSEDTEHPGQSKEGQEDEGGQEKSSSICQDKKMVLLLNARVVSHEGICPYFASSRTSEPSSIFRAFCPFFVLHRALRAKPKNTTLIFR